MEMRKLFLALLLLAPSFCFGQSTYLFGTSGTRATDTAKTLNTLFFPKYATADSNKVLGLDSRGMVVLRTKGTGGSSADSSVFATQYRVDSMRANIYGQIELKLDIADTASHWVGIGWLPALMKYGDTSGMLANYVRSIRSINTTYPVQGGGDLSANRTITVDTGRAVGQLITGGRFKGVLDSAYVAIPNDPTIIGTIQGFIQSSNYSFNTAQHNADFIVIAACIPRVTNISWVNADTIDWILLDYTDGHGASWFNGIENNYASNTIKVLSPRAKYVFYQAANPDESFAQQNITVGPTVSNNTGEYSASRLAPISVRLRGNGTSTWDVNGDAAGITVSTFNTGDGSTLFSSTLQPKLSMAEPTITYNGDNGSTIGRQFSALGLYQFGFWIREEDGTFLGTNPTSGDNVIINLGMAPSQINLTIMNVTNTFLGSNYNFWVWGMFEAWMIVKPAGSTSNIVRWQTNYVAATTYKIYRDTDPTFATETLIHTGTEGTFLDTGLSAETLYYYKMVAVVGGVDTDVTTFNCRTKP